MSSIHPSVSIRGCQMWPVYSSAQVTQGRTCCHEHVVTQEHVVTMQGELKLNLVQPQQVDTQESKVKNMKCRAYTACSRIAIWVMCQDFKV